ncbi:divergent PAP2 family protein [filamentous cyanobacterium LEGE 11480]|uniref:Divergent PAP2 family protein n=1 Tax=Romeriopsis navalis LEGE 11480 TaxID=2777977 RepID=A0A928Z212_9CYAN|nr:divergent PAP2 family protein [Romeriopsis navalis]MBE9028562.1 divergent PAP2 family protein [Romeriopsis navalis LEGE 11480]
MPSFASILENRVLLVALAACLIAQGAKVIVELAQSRRLNFKVMAESGGMPSSHSALVTSLAFGVGVARGWNSVEFAIATVFAIIVMYDAAGVRQSSGKQAQLLNQVISELFQGDHHLTELRVKELLGHTPLQVIVGAILGAAIAGLVEVFLRG